MAENRLENSRENLQKIDLTKDAKLLKDYQIHYMKKLEDENVKRVQKLASLRTRNLATGVGIGAAVLAIYGYSMFAVKQETFLDDMDLEQTK